jgi:hypothetical protein
LNKITAATRLLLVWVLTFHLYLQAYRIVALTEQDADWLRRWFPHIAAKVVSIPISFRADAPPAMSPPALRGHALYAANFYHKPNVDGLVWFLAECAPKIESEVTLHLIGIDDPVRSVSLPDSRIRVVRHGHVDDLGTVCSNISIALAPIVSGGGIRVKNLLFASLGKAIVTTSLANEGIGFEDGKDALVCDSPDAFARGIDRLVADPVLAGLLGRNARSLVEAKFSQNAIRIRYSSEIFAPMMA